MKIQPYEILHKETIIQEEHCHIQKHRVKFPSGQEGDWFVKIRQDAVVVLPLLSDGRVLLQRAYKHGSQSVVIECVAGLVDGDEHPELAAKRELNEETGYDSDTIEYLGTVYADPTGSNMKYHFYRAKDCVKNGEQKLDEAEQIEVFTVDNIEEAKNLLTQPDTRTSSATRSMLSYV